MTHKSHKITKAEQSRKIKATTKARNYQRCLFHLIKIPASSTLSLVKQMKAFSHSTGPPLWADRLCLLLSQREGVVVLQSNSSAWK